MGNLISLLVSIPGASAFEGAHDFTINDGTFVTTGRDFVQTNIQNLHIYRDLQSVLDLLAPNTFRAIQIDTFLKRTPDTGKWFIDSEIFQTWLKGKGEILWGMGMPGAGKTVLASIVIDCLETLARESPGISVAFAYCRYSESMTVSDVLVALIRQQAERHPKVVEIIGPALERHQRENTKPSQEELLGMLQDISKLFDITYYSLDALDEAPKDARFNLLTTLASVNANFFITSRPLEGLKSAVPNAVFFEIAAIDSDIELFVAQRIEEDPEFRELLDKSNMRAEVMARVREKAGGMFLHAALQVEALQQCLTLAELRETIDELPLKIEEMYITTLARIAKQSDRHARRAKLILLWVIYTERSLTLQELQLAISLSSKTGKFDATDIVSQENIIALCCGLVTLDKESQLVRLIHYTAKDALRPLLAHDFPHPHAPIVKTCIARLASCNFQESNLATRGELEEAFEQTPLLPYAYLALGLHARNCKDPQTRHLIAFFIFKCLYFPYIPYEYMSRHDYLDHLNPIQVATFYNLPTTLRQVLKTEQVGRPRYSIGTSTLEHAITPLHIACHRGLEEIAKVLIDHSATMDVNATDNRGMTALLKASSEGHENIVRLLTNIPGIIVDLATDDGWTPLMAASAAGYDTIVQLLLRTPGIDPNLEDRKGRTALWVAWMNNQEEVMHLLLKAPGVDVNQIGDEGWTTLMRSASIGDIKNVQILLNIPGINANIRDENGWTALMKASSDGHEEIVKLLIQKSDVNLPNKAGYTPLIQASLNRREAIVRLLLGIPGIDVNAQNNSGDSTLLGASDMGYGEIVRLLLDSPAIDVNLQGKGGWTALMRASSQGQQEIVRMLVSAPGIDANVRDDETWTALMHASSWGYEEIVTVLLSAPGIDINLQDNFGRSALMHATAGMYPGVVRLLLRAPGIDVNLQDHYGQTSLNKAVGVGYRDVARLLIEIPTVDVNKPDKRGWTPLMNASHMGDAETTQMLLNVSGIEVNTLNDDGSTALTLAFDEGSVHTVELVLNRTEFDINRPNAYGWTLLQMAAYRGDEKMVELLLSRPGIQTCLGNEHGDTALILAAREGNETIARLLLFAPEADPNEANNHGSTALLLAAETGHESMVELLLNTPGMRPHLTDGDGDTALIVASYSGHENVVRHLLLALPEDQVNTAETYGLTPLMLASSKGHNGIVRLLLDVPSIDTHLVDVYGCNALTWALVYGHEGVVKLLENEH